LLDVGGNTGKWALACVRHNPEVVVTILDRQAQLDLALTEARKQGFEGRVRGANMDLLDHSLPYPKDQDVVWMSQFLSCFGEADVKELLCRAVAALSPKGEVHILETLWDRQPHDGAAFTLQQTSLYFASMANGVSRIYDTASLEACCNDAGLKVSERVDALGTSHTLLRCVRA
jgi:ubiquinone/menaquinone biosynthesis C-methylase UbiE